MDDNTQNALVNEFAIRCFRDVADGDYIAARMAFRTHLMPQFLWSSLQAIEKYLKCILLLNRIPATRMLHDLDHGLQKITAEAKFPLRRSASTDKFIKYLDTYGRFRYFETPYHTLGREIVSLDRAVWEIRRYCTVLDYTATIGGIQKPMLEIELKRIARSEKIAPQLFRHSFNGKLEEIVKDVRHPARSSLIWQNAFYGKSVRRKVRLPRSLRAANSPLSLFPEIVDEVVKYVHLPKDVKNGYRDIARRARRGADSFNEVRVTPS